MTDANRHRSTNCDDFLNSLKNAQLALETMSVYEAREVFAVTRAFSAPFPSANTFLYYCELIQDHNGGKGR